MVACALEDGREREREKLLGNAFTLKFIRIHLIKRISNAINIIKIERFLQFILYIFVLCIKIIIMDIIFYNKILILSL